MSGHGYLLIQAILQALRLYSWGLSLIKLFRNHLVPGVLAPISSITKLAAMTKREMSCSHGSRSDRRTTRTNSPLSSVAAHVTALLKQAGSAYSLTAYSHLNMQVPKSSIPAAAAAQAVKTAVCPSVRFCSRCKIQQRALNRRSRAQPRSRRHLVRALDAEAEVEEPSTHKKRGRKKNTKPQLPSVRRPVQQFQSSIHFLQTSSRAAAVCSQLHTSKQSRTRLYLGALVCTQANTVYIACDKACDNKGPLPACAELLITACLACSNCAGDASSCG